MDLLETGDTLHISIFPKSGNLDPVAVLIPAKFNVSHMTGDIQDTITKTLKSGGDLVESGKNIANRYFLAWDDDSGPGYSSEFTYTIQDSGNYFLVALSNPFSKNYGSCTIQVDLTKKYSFRNQPGISHTPEIYRNTSVYHTDSRIQIVNSSLVAGKSIKYYLLNPVTQGDTFYLSAKSRNGSPFRILLKDFGGKTLATGEYLGKTNTTLKYTFKESGDNYRLEIRPSDLTLSSVEIPFIMVTGLNDPSVLSGEPIKQGQDILKLPIKVKIGVELDQITDVDQRAENFAIVGNIWMQWTDPEHSFNPWSCNCSRKTYQSVEGFIRGESSRWPDFIIYNQQERRWTQNILISLTSDGNITYYERFWDTLQAPDFDFRNYPFDSQKFFIRIDSLYPIDNYEFVAWPEKTRVGNQLGEEEWIVLSSQSSVSTVNLTDINSRYSFGFTAVRQIQYYIFRIIIPIVIILLLTYISFLLTDYAKRADIASANLLILVAYSFMIGDDIPRVGYLTFLDTILVISFIITGMTTVYNFYLKWVASAKTKVFAEKIDHIMVWLYPIIYLVSIAILLLSERLF